MADDDGGGIFDVFVVDIGAKIGVDDTKFEWFPMIFGASARVEPYEKSVQL